MRFDWFRYDGIGIKEFANDLLPQLVSHYRHEALKALEGKCPWLKTFTTVEPDFNEARDQFLRDGSACILDFEDHIKLMRLAITNEELTYHFGLVYICFMAKLDVGHVQKVFQAIIERGADMRLDSLIDSIKVERLRASGWTGSDISVFLEAGQEILEDRQPKRTKFKKIYTVKTITKKFREALKYNECSANISLQGILDCTKRVFEVSKSQNYISKIKDFTYKVGCPEAYEDPERNTLELRKFHATQMPFFSKLQGDLQAQINSNNEQQEIITALVFRHLLENFPVEQTKNTTSTSRWQEFWVKAAEKAAKEHDNPNSDHPLHGVIDSTAFTKSGVISTGAKGHSVRTGRDLYGTLSENIHKYKGGGQGGYVIRKDQWGLSIRKILNALVPTKFDDDGEVDWKEERKRYGIGKEDKIQEST